MKNILITGARGFLGRPLNKKLREQGYTVITANRGSPSDLPNSITWDAISGQIEKDKLGSIDAVIHLAGENIAKKRWTKAFKQKILDSRVKGTELISQTIANLPIKPKVLLSASATGFYGNRPGETLIEQSAPGVGFLPDVCQAWEKATKTSQDNNIRVINCRFSVILHRTGGALAQMALPFWLGIGGRLGNGQQIFSWISLEDAIRAVIFCLENHHISGPVNISSPNPITNKELTKTLGKHFNRPTFLSVPKFALRTALGGVSAELLSSTKALPNVLLQNGFIFNQPKITDILPPKGSTVV